MIASVTESLLPMAAWILFASPKITAIIALVLLIRRLCARWLTRQGLYGLWFAVIACLSIPFGVQVNIRNQLQAAAPAASRVVSQPSIASHEQPIIRIDAAVR